MRCEETFKGVDFDGRRGGEKVWMSPDRLHRVDVLKLIRWWSRKRRICQRETCSRTEELVVDETGPHEATEKPRALEDTLT
jgi:hypothetical protein